MRNRLLVHFKGFPILQFRFSRCNLNVQWLYHDISMAFDALQYYLLYKIEIILFIHIDKYHYKLRRICFGIYLKWKNMQILIREIPQIALEMHAEQRCANVQNRF